MINEWTLKCDSEETIKEKDEIQAIENLEHFLLECDAYDTERENIQKHMGWSKLGKDKLLQKMAGNLSKNENPQELLKYIRISFSRRYKALYKKSIRNEWWIGNC